MKCSVYIAASVDGYIAKHNGDVSWLDSVGNRQADMGDHADMGWHAYFSSVDCLVMGRKCMQVIADMNLSLDQWPYGDTRIVVLSNTLKQLPKTLHGNVELYSGDIYSLIELLEQDGHKHVYVDGGQTIQSFLELKLIHQITITRAPILLGGGIPLFAKMPLPILLKQAKSIAYANDFVQEHYAVSYL
ncbi:dihydrofolate reductase [Vibrio sp. qd031]|uniref:dihydrofolate reductase family protein n=1 Tax=Vibrio sp. qd031 TaxID=1603038 RepID=UPI000A11B333|nr:dihydrofolate reductase family protein [Vibrio sp. qd031]ORT52829.1 dihydrofolate reductase [Vibrio sp. qd031]